MPRLIIFAIVELVKWFVAPFAKLLLKRLERTLDRVSRAIDEEPRRAFRQQEKLNDKA